VIATAELLEAINTDDELPFGGWSEGKGLDGRGLARLLKPYGIRRRTVRVGEHTPKGYRRADMQEAWERYLPSSEGQQGKQGQQVDEANHENPLGDVARVARVARVDGVEGDVAHTSGNETLADRAVREYGVQA
jgi:hypothetical protein